MAANTSIEWAANADGTPGATWNPIRAHYFNGRTTKHGFHCVHVSEGCRFCYAETLNVAARFPGVGTGLAYTKPNEAKVTVYLDADRLAIPLRRRKPTTYFLSSMTDVFADFVSDADLDRLFGVMLRCPRHTFIVLTKRADRMRKYFTQVNLDDTPQSRSAYHSRQPSGASLERAARIAEAASGVVEMKLGRDQPTLPLPNVWLVVSIEDQPNADARCNDLLATPAAVRGVSYEPALGPLDLTRIWLRMPGGGQSLTDVLRSGCCGTHKHPGDPEGHDHGPGTSRHVGDPRFQHHHHDEGCTVPRIDWVICGGESGRNARPMHPAWARSMRDQCAAAGVPFFFKQWGEWAPDKFLSNMKAEEEESASFIAGKECHEFDDAEVWRLGKAKAGRILDGRTHDERPKFHEVAGRKGEAGLLAMTASPGSQGKENA